MLGWAVGKKKIILLCWHLSLKRYTWHNMTLVEDSRSRSDQKAFCSKFIFAQMQTALAPVDALSDDDAGIVPARGASSSMVACPQPIAREAVVVTPQSVHRIVMSNTCCKKHCFQNFRDSDGMSYVYKTAKHYHSLSKMEQDKFVRTQDYCCCVVVILRKCFDQISTSFLLFFFWFKRFFSNVHEHTSSDLRSST